MSPQSQPTPPPTTSEATPNWRSSQPRPRRTGQRRPACHDPTGILHAGTRVTAGASLPSPPPPGSLATRTSGPRCARGESVAGAAGGPATGTTTAPMLARWLTRAASTVTSTQWAQTGDDPCPERGQDCPSVAPAAVSTPPPLLANAMARRRLAPKSKQSSRLRSPDAQSSRSGPPLAASRTTPSR
jgi:hypothetical protein